MNCDEAIKVLERVAAAMVGNLADHQAAQSALKAIREALSTPPATPPAAAE